MSDQLPDNAPPQAALNLAEIKLSNGKGLPAVSLVLTNVKLAKSRLHEAQHVNPATYSELEHCFGESYRDIQKFQGIVGAHILKCQTLLERARGVALMDKFPEYLKGKPASANNAAQRDAFVGQDPEVALLTDHLDTLKGVELLLKGEERVMENVCRWMRQRMKLIERSGVDPSFFINAFKNKS